MEWHQLPSGHQLDLSVYTYGEHTKNDKTVYIQSSVHGAELQGNLVIFELHQILKSLNVLGKIIMVPLANPLATSQKQGSYTQGRFNPVTGDNWNRNYTDIINAEEHLTGLDLDKIILQSTNIPSEEIRKEFKKTLKVALENYLRHITNEKGPSLNKIPNLKLQILAAEADIVLDLHTGPVATDYIYSAEFQKPKVKELNFPHHLIIPNEFAGAMDEACFCPWYNLQERLKKLGHSYQTNFEAYTVELGSEEFINSKLAKIQALRLADFLAKRGVIESLPASIKAQVDVPMRQYWCLLKDYKTYYSKFGGLFEYLVKPGDLLKKEDVMGKFYFLHQLETQTPFEHFKAKEDCVVINHSTSSAVHQGQTLFQVMEKFQTF